LSELVFCKLGGSIITDKRRPSTARPEMIERLAQEIAQAMAGRPALRLLLGHGAGSFGHVVAKKYGVHQGIADGEDWWGYAETGAVAAQLNCLVTDTFIRVGVPVVTIQPSASARCRGGELIALDEYPIREALRHRLVPLIHGDVAFDSDLGCTIVSTEAEFAYLARALRPPGTGRHTCPGDQCQGDKWARIVLVGEVHGVYDRDPLAEDTANARSFGDARTCAKRGDRCQGGAARHFPRITPGTFAEIEARLGGSPGTDVTGGMLTKVRGMVDLVEQGLVQRVHLISGHTKGALTRVLLDPQAREGTVIEK
jgi:isopentenyl phosphate kinase